MSGSARAFLGIGLSVGVLAGVWDAAALRLENPKSFSPSSAIAFAVAAIALYAALGLAAGASAAVFARLSGRPRPGDFAAIAFGVWLFAWAGVRVHVRWFFGEPLLSPNALLANTALLAACLALSWSLRRPLRALEVAAARRPFAWGAAAVAVLAASFAIARAPLRETPPARPSPPPGARDVLLVTLDTTRHDHLSAFGYPRGTTPAIDRVARRGSSDILWAPVPLTNPSHVSLFTGLPPGVHGVWNNGTALSDTIPTIVDAFAREGWACGAFVSGIPLKAGLSGLARSFERYDDSFSALERVHPMMTSLAAVRVADRLLPGDLLERRAESTVDAALDWFVRTASPRFLWVHVFDPHTPYRASREWNARFARESKGWLANGRPATAWPIADYDAELRQTDRALGALFREFSALAPAGILAIAADHGEGLLQHGELTHGTLLHEEDLRIGWIVAGAGPEDESAAARLRGDRPPRPATDGANILEALARGAPAPSRDASIVRADTFPPEGRGRKTATLGPLPGGGIGKTIVDWESGDRFAYRIDVDPGETRPLAIAGGEWARLLPEDEQSATSGALDPDVERRLRALGYVH